MSMTYSVSVYDGPVQDLFDPDIKTNSIQFDRLSADALNTIMAAAFKMGYTVTVWRALE